MFFSCTSCGTRLQLPDDQVLNRVLKVRCTSCSATMTLKDGSTGPNERPTQEWFVALAGQQKGPMSLADLRSLVHGGRVDERSYAWSIGMATWMRAGEIEALGELFRTKPVVPITGEGVRRPTLVLQALGSGAPGAPDVPTGKTITAMPAYVDPIELAPVRAASPVPPPSSAIIALAASGAGAPSEAAAHDALDFLGELPPGGAASGASGPPSAEAAASATSVPSSALTRPSSELTRPTADEVMDMASSRRLAEDVLGPLSGAMSGTSEEPEPDLAAVLREASQLAEAEAKARLGRDQGEAGWSVPGASDDAGPARSLLEPPPIDMLSAAPSAADNDIGFELGGSLAMPAPPLESLVKPIAEPASPVPAPSPAVSAFAPSVSVASVPQPALAPLGDELGFDDARQRGSNKRWVWIALAVAAAIVLALILMTSSSDGPVLNEPAAATRKPYESVVRKEAVGPEPSAAPSPAPAPAPSPSAEAATAASAPGVEPVTAPATRPATPRPVTGSPAPAPAAGDAKPRLDLVVPSPDPRAGGGMAELDPLGKGEAKIAFDPGDASRAAAEADKEKAGGLGAEVAEAFGKKKAQFAKCSDAAQERVKVHFTVGTDGKTSGISVDGATSDTKSKCIRAILDRAVFPAGASAQSYSQVLVL